MIKKYGKSLVDVLLARNDFISQNSVYLAHYQKVAAEYRKQPKRISCKLCCIPLPEDISFESHGIGYKICVNCSHLNGEYEDTLEFAEKVYVEEDYGKLDYYVYDKTKFLRRMHAIYEPKAKFLIDSLNTLGEDTYNYKYIDYGAGSGYFVFACRQLGLNASGVDLSKDQVAFANRIMEADTLRVITHGTAVDYIKNADCDVISFINVLEHIRDLNDTLKAMSENPRIKYVYFNVPLFSLTCLLEVMNQESWNRQLGADHTHLYTKKSLDWLYNHYQYKPVAVWDFGSEMMDFMRFMILDLTRKGMKQDLIEVIRQYFINSGDEIQMAIDRSGFASETHVLMKKI